MKSITTSLSAPARMKTFSMSDWARNSVILAIMLKGLYHIYPYGGKEGATNAPASLKVKRI